MKDKLWFYNAYRYWGSINYLAGLYYNATPTAWTYTPDLSRQADTRVVDGSSNLRLTWQVNAEEQDRRVLRLPAALHVQPELQLHRLAGSDAVGAVQAEPVSRRRPGNTRPPTGFSSRPASARTLSATGTTRRQPGVASRHHLGHGAVDRPACTARDTSYSNNLNAPVILRALA